MATITGKVVKGLFVANNGTGKGMIRVRDSRFGKFYTAQAKVGSAVDLSAAKLGSEVILEGTVMANVSINRDKDTGVKQIAYGYREAYDGQGNLQIINTETGEVIATVTAWDSMIVHELAA